MPYISGGLVEVMCAMDDNYSPTQNTKLLFVSKRRLDLNTIMDDLKGA